MSESFNQMYFFTFSVCMKHIRCIHKNIVHLNQHQDTLHVVVFSSVASRGSCGSVYLGLFQSVAADSGPPQPVGEKGLFTVRGPKPRERCDI